MIELFKKPIKGTVEIEFQDFLGLVQEMAKENFTLVAISKEENQVALVTIERIVGKQIINPYLKFQVLGLSGGLSQIAGQAGIKIANLLLFAVIGMPLTALYMYFTNRASSLALQYAFFAALFFGISILILFLIEVLAAATIGQIYRNQLFNNFVSRFAIKVKEEEALKRKNS